MPFNDKLRTLCTCRYIYRPLQDVCRGLASPLLSQIAAMSVVYSFVFFYHGGTRSLLRWSETCPLIVNIDPFSKRRWTTYNFGQVMLETVVIKYANSSSAYRKFEVQYTSLGSSIWIKQFIYCAVPALPRWPPSLPRLVRRPQLGDGRLHPAVLLLGQRRHRGHVHEQVRSVSISFDSIRYSTDTDSTPQIMCLKAILSHCLGASDIRREDLHQSAYTDLNRPA